MTYSAVQTNKGGLKATFRFTGAAMSPRSPTVAVSAIIGGASTPGRRWAQAAPRRPGGRAPIVVVWRILFRPENGAGRLAAVADLVDDHGCRRSVGPQADDGRRPARRRPGGRRSDRGRFRAILFRPENGAGRLAAPGSAQVGPQADDGRRPARRRPGGRRSDPLLVFAQSRREPSNGGGAPPRSTAAAPRRSQMTAGGRLG